METEQKKRGLGIDTLIYIIVGVISIQIIDGVLTDANFTGLLATVTDNITVDRKSVV